MFKVVAKENIAADWQVRFRTHKLKISQKNVRDLDEGAISIITCSLCLDEHNKHKSTYFVEYNK